MQPLPFRPAIIASPAKETTLSPEAGYHSYLLPSGLRVIIYPDDNPVMYAGYIIATGSKNDPLRYHGMAHFVEHMLFKGTQLRNARQIINRIEEVGADFNAFTTKEETFIYTAFPQEHLNRVLQLMTDVVLHSTVPTIEAEREKGVIVEEINSYKDSPADLIFDEFENLLFRGTPLGHNILGTEESVGRISSEAARNFMSAHYLPSRMAFCLRGQVDETLLFAFLNYHFSPLAQSAKAPVDWRETTDIKLKPLPTKKAMAHRMETFQVHRILGCHAYSLQHKQRIGLTLLSNLLGGRGMNSRLNLNLREEKGLVYSVESTFTPFLATGYLSIYFGAAKSNLKLATDGVYEELERLKQELISPEELRMAKRQIMGQLAIQEDNRETAFLDMGKSFLYFDRYNSMDDIKARFERLTAEELRDIARELFRKERMLTLTYY